MKDTVIAFLPTLIYAVVMVILNIAKAVHGPYPFLYVYEQPIYMSVVWGIVIPGIAWIIAIIIRLVKNRMYK